VLNHACNVMTASRACLHKNNLDSYAGAPCASSGGDDIGKGVVTDIEQLVAIGKSVSACLFCQLVHELCILGARVDLSERWMERWLRGGEVVRDGW
jgi:hypothetical protein